MCVLSLSCWKLEFLFLFSFLTKEVVIIPLAEKAASFMRDAATTMLH